MPNRNKSTSITHMIIMNVIVKLIVNVKTTKNIATKARVMFRINSFLKITYVSKTKY